MTPAEVEARTMMTLTNVVYYRTRVIGRMHWWADLQELEQEAWMAALEAKKNHRDGAGASLKAFAEKAVDYALYEWVRQNATCLRPAKKKAWDWSKVIELPIGRRGNVLSDRRGDRGGSHGEIADDRVVIAGRAGEPLVSEAKNPEELLDEARRSHRLETLVQDIVADFAAPEVADHCHLLGDKRSREIEKTTQIKMSKIQAIVRDTKAAIANDVSVRKLWREVG